MSDSTGTLQGSDSGKHRARLGGGRRLAGAAASVLALALVAACGSGSVTAKPVVEEADSVTTSQAPTTSGAAPTSSPAAPRPTTVEAPVSDRRAERLTDSSRLRLDGIGPIEVGMSLEEASAATGMNVRIVGEDYGTGCRYAEAAGGPTGLSFMVEAERIVRIDVGGRQEPSPIKTLSGISVGSSEDEVMAAYPGRIRVTANAYSDTHHDLVYDSSDPALGLIFVTDGERVISFRSGQAGPVSAIEGCA